jgi:hypothetical protein
VDFPREGREDEWMPGMDGALGARTRGGQLVVLAGVAVFLVGAFLPLHHLQQPGGSLSLVRQMTSGPFDIAGAWIVGGVVLVFGTSAVVAALAVLGLAGREQGSPAAALVGATIVWSLTWVSGLLRSSGFPVGAGYYVMWAGVAVVAVGTLMVVLSMRRASERVTERSS